jgi:cysteine-rich repeat protein
MDDADDCTNACTIALCGDGVVQAGVESCDDGNVDDGDGCSATCFLETCGDGVLDDGEECDDGNMAGDDACTSLCMNAVCGDGVVQAGVDLCDDGNLEDTDDCTSTCTPAACGDGFVWAGMEECDDANMDDADMCLNACTNAICGDAVIQAGVEQCDDGNGMAGDGCSDTCTAEGKLVFASSELYNGNLGGLMGADAKCQALADAANLGGTYMAWISTNMGSPSTRFTQSALPYITVTGVVIANDWADLIDGSLAAPIDVTETGGLVPVATVGCQGGGHQLAWSATTPAGAIGNAMQTCQGWTNGAMGQSNWGRATNINAGWTNFCQGNSCAATAALYCFEQ